MTITSFKQLLDKHQARYQQQVDEDALREFMTAHYQTMKAQQIADVFGISAITVKRYAKKFRMNKNRKQYVPKVETELQPNQRRIKTGILTVIGNKTIHESGVKASMQ